MIVGQNVAVLGHNDTRSKTALFERLRRAAPSVVAKRLTEESPEFQFRIAGVADEFGALYRAEGLDTAELLRLRAARRPIVEYSGARDALWIAAPSETDRARAAFRGTDSREQPANKEAWLAARGVTWRELHEEKLDALV